MNLSEKLTSSTVVKNTTVRKNQTVEVNMKYTPFENVIAVKEIVQFMIDYDLPKERVIEVLNDMVSIVDKKPNHYYSRDNIEYLKQILIKNDR